MFAKFPFCNFPGASASACRYLVCFLRLQMETFRHYLFCGNSPGELGYFSDCRFFTIGVAFCWERTENVLSRRGALCLASVRHAAVTWLVGPIPSLRVRRFSLLPNGGNQRRRLRGVVGFRTEA